MFCLSYSLRQTFRPIGLRFAFGKSFGSFLTKLSHLNPCLGDCYTSPTFVPHHCLYHIVQPNYVSMSRVQATLYAVSNWVEAKSASNIQAWNVSHLSSDLSTIKLPPKVADFFIVNHGDLAKMTPIFDLLQVALTNYLSFIYKKDT